MRMTAKICWFILVALMTLPLVGCGGQAAAPVPAKPSGPSPMEQAEMQFFWERQLLLSPNESVRKIYLLDENIYYLTSEKVLIAMDATVGTIKWRQPITYKAEAVFAPIHFDDMRLPKKVGTVADVTNPPSLHTFPKFDAVLINTFTGVKIFNRKTGEIIRDIRFGDFSATAGGATDGERYYAPSNTKLIYAIKLHPAVIIWTKELAERVRAPLLCRMDKLYAASTKGLFRCLSADDLGSKLWQIRLDDPITTPFKVVNSNAYITCQDGRVYALNSNSGEEVWSPVQTQGLPQGKIVVEKTTAFQYSKGAGLCAINLADGKLRWTLPTGKKVLAVMGEDVCVIDARKNLLVVNLQTGQVSHSVPLQKYDIFATNAAASAIYAVTYSGKACCIRKTSAGRLTVEMLN